MFTQKHAQVTAHALSLCNMVGYHIQWILKSLCKGMLKFAQIIESKTVHCLCNY